MPTIDPIAIEYTDLAFGFHARLRNRGEPAVFPDRATRNAWGDLADVLWSCREGDFSGLPGLLDLLLRVDDHLFRVAIVNLLGCAGSWGLIERFASELDSAVPFAQAHHYAARILSISCHSAAVGPLLRLYPRGQDLDDRLTVSHALSFLLEDGPGPIWFGADEEDSSLGPTEEARVRVAAQEHLDLVHDRIAALRPVPQRGGGTLFEGAPLDVVGTARRLLARLGSEEPHVGWVFREALVFGAATGADCTPFWSPRRALRRIDAMAVVETILDGSDLARYEIGRRYFFGHPVPD
jgi:hypothetical protein